VTEVNASPVLSGVPATRAWSRAHAADVHRQRAPTATSRRRRSRSRSTGAPPGQHRRLDRRVQLDAHRGAGPGVYTFSVNVSDGVTSTSASITSRLRGERGAGARERPASATIPELRRIRSPRPPRTADQPPQTLTFSLVGAPAGATIDGSTGAFSWTPSEAQARATIRSRCASATAWRTRMPRSRSRDRGERGAGDRERAGERDASPSCRPTRSRRRPRTATSLRRR
jgi:hypothetical protein